MTHHRGLFHSALPRLIVVLNLMTLALIASAASFPDVTALPSRPDLPDPLVQMNGKRVTHAAQWQKQRRAELKNLFAHYMYGHFPKTAKTRAVVDRVDTNALGGKATLKEVTLSFGLSAGPEIHLLLVVPNQHSAPVPAFAGLNFCGNHQLLPDPGIRVPTGWMYDRYPGVTNNRATEAGRGGQVEVWALEQSIDRGYAVAVFYNGDVEPDRPEAAEGMRARFPKADWGTIAAWAWGLQRVVDYLVTDPAIDARRIAVVGHSRNGKAALVAAAFDERIALAIPHQAGCGGTAPSRGTVGESVKQINDRFPHWFNAEFKKFNPCPDRLPFDQHCLVALCAPRPVLFSNAVEDTWANPAGQFEVLKAADPVYRLLGVPGLGATQMPEPNRLVDSRLGYFIRPGRHSMTTEDWKAFLDFADKQYGRK